MQEKFGRWPLLLGQYCKRDWQKILVWVLGLSLFSGAFVPAFKEISKGQGLIGMYETMQNPAMISMVGPTPIKHAANYTIGAMYANEMLLFCALFAMIIAALHVISHTRKEEDLGLTELVRSYQVGRQANALAVLLETILINVLLGIVTTGIMVSFGTKSIDFAGASLFSTSIALAGILGAGIGLLLAQIMPSAAGATGASIGLIGILYMVRAGTDVSNLDASVFNPLAWTYLTYPFTHNDWLPVLWGVILMVIIAGASFALGGKRDMGAGFLPAAEGRAHASILLRSVPGLLNRLNRGTIISWLVGFAVMGMAYGSIYGDIHTFIDSNPLIKQMFATSGHSIEESFTSTIMMVMISLVSILPIVIINKLFNEESHERFGQLFATKVSRAKLYWTNFSLALIASVIGILVATASLGGVALASMSHSNMDLGDFLAAGFNFLPSVLFILGLAELCSGWAPRWGKAVYIYLGYSFGLNYFGGILDLPDWFSKTAIQSWLPRLPIDKFDMPTFITITVISCAMIIIGFIGYHRRDMVEGA